MGKILINGVLFIIFVRFSHHQSFALYNNSVCAAVLQLKLTKLPLLLLSSDVVGVLSSGVVGVLSSGVVGVLSSGVVGVLSSGIVGVLSSGVLGEGSSPGMFGSSTICHPR